MDAGNAQGRRRASWAFVEGLILAAALLAAIYGATRPGLGDSANSRLATVWSLAHHGTWELDAPATVTANPFAPGTVDLVEIEGSRYSTKPPLLPLAMLGIYEALRPVTGWTLAEEAGRANIVFVMVLLLMVLPHMAGLWCFSRILALLEFSGGVRCFLLFAAAFATELPGFSTNINNHTPGAALNIAAIYIAIGLHSGKHAPQAWQFLLFGALAAGVFTLDMPMTIYPGIAGLVLLWRFPRQALLWGGLGAAPLLLLHFGVMYSVTGSLLPIQMRKELYLYEASYWRNPAGLDALQEPKLLYFFHMCFGRFGTFLLFPCLLFGPAALLRVFKDKTTEYRGYVLAGALGFAILTAYYVQGTNNYGGASYGFRWHFGSMPVLLLMAAPWIAGLKHTWQYMALLVPLAVSLFSAYECYLAPWGAQHEWTCRLLFGPLY